MPTSRKRDLESRLQKITATNFNPLDLLPEGDLPEKLINLVLLGPPSGPTIVKAIQQELANSLIKVATKDVNVVVFGGGTGLSNIIGGDSRTPGWSRAPFQGLKAIFPKTCAIVCVTDDGGSTGELLKAYPLVALGDIRHVLLSCIKQSSLENKYSLHEDEALAVADALYRLFNFRFAKKPASPEELIKECGIDSTLLPVSMWHQLADLLAFVFTDKRLSLQLAKPHCLGNLILAAAFFRQLKPDEDFNEKVSSTKFIKGVQYLAEIIGADRDSVLPCTTTPASLKMCYANGVTVTGEYKSSIARRGYPVDRVFVEFVSDPKVPRQVLQAIAKADIILFAPGSLFTSIIPILQVPGIAEAVRNNQQALKILVANLWIQRGETDLVQDDPRRRYYVSDLIQSYNRNIPGGVKGLFKQILALSLHDIPGSVLQNYAFEDKVPIYLDKTKVRELGFMPIESQIYSQRALEERNVIQHGPDAIARSVRTLWAIRDLSAGDETCNLPAGPDVWSPLVNQCQETPDQRIRVINLRLQKLDLSKIERHTVSDIFWRHRDIPAAHLEYINGLSLINPEDWNRSQSWDNVFSFFDPIDNLIKIRRDIVTNPLKFEVAFLVALGQSLLGNYAAAKRMAPVFDNGRPLGKVYFLRLCPPEERKYFLTTVELTNYLSLARMRAVADDPLLYTRLVNAKEGFTPPGLLFGLVYAWYLDNRFAAHVEYKMSIFRTEISDLIPEQVKISSRRRELIDFFRKVVFQIDVPWFQEDRLPEGQG